MKAQDSTPTSATAASIHEPALVSAFVIPEKRSRYSEFLSKPKRRSEILDHINHAFDFVPERATQVRRVSATEFAQMLRTRGAGQLAYVIGGDRDGCELPLKEAIESSLDSRWGTFISCVPGRLALYLQELPPGNAFIFSA